MWYPIKAYIIFIIFATEQRLRLQESYRHKSGCTATGSICPGTALSDSATAATHARGIRAAGI